jgi:hypothetical protein
MTRFHKTGVFRNLAFLLLVMIMMRALVPAGFMPDFGAGGKVTLVLCESVQGRADPRAVTLAKELAAATHDDRDGGQKGGDKKEHGGDNTSCVFAVAFAKTLPGLQSTDIPLASLSGGARFLPSYDAPVVRRHETALSLSQPPPVLSA